LLAPLLVPLLAAAPTSRPTSAPATQPVTGAFTLQFTDRTPSSAIKEQIRRFGWRMEQMRGPKDEADYELPNETFDVVVPDAYAPGDAGWGLLVWVSPGGRGSPPKAWLDTLAKHKLIWVGAQRSGNERAIWCRVGLAVDAAVTMQRRYRVEPSRVYVSGMSGGGRTASMIGLAYADLFAGGIYCCGVNFYRDVEAPPQPGEHLGPNQRRVYPKSLNAPPAKLLTQSKQNFRHVLLTGETDMNRESTQVMFDKAFKHDGFKHVEYIEVPGMGHELPPAEWFDKAIEALDAAATTFAPPSPRR
jgi:hypothetical protein